MSYRYSLLIACIILGMMIITCILSQKNTGSALRNNTDFKPRGASSVINTIISILFPIFVVLLILLGQDVTREAEAAKLEQQKKALAQLIELIKEQNKNEPLLNPEQESAISKPDQTTQINIEDDKTKVIDNIKPEQIK